MSSFSGEPGPLPDVPASADAAARAVALWRAGPDGTRPGTDELVVEEPLEVRLGQRSLLVTMRTPGHDLDLVRGLLFTEGLVASPADVTGLAMCRDVPPEALGNVVMLSLAPGASLDEVRTARAGLTVSACGVCGKASLEALATLAPPVPTGAPWDLELLSRLPAVLQQQQPVFGRTGGLHGAGLFDRQGRLLASAEDVGRHNAVDKVIGQAIRFRRLPMHDALLLVSGRAGFEIVQKARRAGIPVVCSVSAPSSLALDLARDGCQALVGFLRDGRCNVYCGAERLRGLHSSNSPETPEIKS
ncbi:MAG: formate dehydrogenase accessory sulfurtransferase FdhD [Planctomycetota bacterium]|nr:MAG: formate dehydrogenase accessory sulfurtransferase FdhD [Planctomycetota bacterium]